MKIPRKRPPGTGKVLLLFPPRKARDVEREENGEPAKVLAFPSQEPKESDELRQVRKRFSASSVVHRMQSEAVLDIVLALANADEKAVCRCQRALAREA